MLAANEYLPIGSVVLLKNAIKKIMVIGIMPSHATKDAIVNEYDYIGVTYPEGFVTTDNLLLFNHDKISDVVFTGYENPEREDFILRINDNMSKIQDALNNNGAGED